MQMENEQYKIVCLAAIKNQDLCRIPIGLTQSKEGNEESNTHFEKSHKRGITHQPA